MRSQLISGLLSADKSTLANFIAMWDESTISNILKHKSSDLYESMINKNDENGLAELLVKKNEELAQREIEELRTIILIQLASYFKIKLPKQFNLYSLEQVGLQIERKTISALRKIDKKFTGTSTKQMIGYTFQSLFDDMAKQFESNDDKIKEKISQDILKTIQSMPEEQQEKLKQELKVDQLTEAVVQKAIVAGTLGTAFATTISIVGFSAYTFATSALASMAGLVGLTLPFGAYTSLTSLMAVVSSPVFLIGAMGLMIYILNSKSNESIRNKLSPIVVSLVSVLSVKSDDFFCESEKYMQGYNNFLTTYQSATNFDKEKVERKIYGLKECEFEQNSVFNLSSVPSSILATCDASMKWMNQPIQQTSLYDKLKKFFDNPMDIDDNLTDYTIASLTVGDLIYDMSRVDPLVVESFDFARKADISDLAGFAYFSQSINPESVGNISQLKGYVAERLVAQKLQSQGYEVEFPETSNQSGYDLLVNNQPFQVKCGDDPSLLNEHFEKYPDIPAFVNEELGAMFVGNQLVFTVPGIRNDDITDLTISQIEVGNEIIDYEIPLITLAVVSGKNIFSVLQNKLDIESAIGRTIEEGTVRITGAFAGSNLLMLGGLIWMPAAGVVGGAVGAVLGSMTVAKLVEKLKVAHLLKDESNDIDSAIKNLLTKSLPIAEQNLQTAENKFNKVKNILEQKKETDTLKYIEYRYTQEKQYRLEKIGLMKKALRDNVFILDEESSNILIASQNAIIITEQVGIHPYMLRLEMEALVQSIQVFNHALSASKITEYVKKEIFDSEMNKKVSQLAQSGMEKAKKWFNKVIG